MADNTKMPVAFTDQHNKIYDYMRTLLQSLHMGGVPGMDKVLSALHNTHTKLISPIAQDYGGEQTETPSTDYNA